MPSFGPPSPPLGPAQNASRVRARRTVIEAETATVWVVTERDARGIPAARAAACLLFDRPAAVRRVWTYRPTWQRLTDPARVALTWGV